MLFTGISHSIKLIFHELDKTVNVWKAPEDQKLKPTTEETLDLEVSGKDIGDFKFRLEDPVTMLPADELFSFIRIFIRICCCLSSRM